LSKHTSADFDTQTTNIKILHHTGADFDTQTASIQVQQHTSYSNNTDIPAEECSNKSRAPEN
jgi:hypothetical protein